MNLKKSDLCKTIVVIYYYLYTLVLEPILNHARIRSWNQPVLSNTRKVSCSRKQRGPLMGLEPTTSTLRVRRATHCTTPPLI